jgi:hypothetical protein
VGFIIKGLKVIIGLVVFLVVIGAIFGNHSSTPAATTSQPTDTKTAYTRDNVNFISKDRVDENIKAGLAKSGDYKEVQVPLSTVVVGGYAPDSGVSKQGETSTPAQQIQSSASPTPSSTPVNAENPSSTHSKPSDNIKVGQQYTVVSGFFGFIDESECEKAVKLLTQGDKEAFDKMVTVDVLNGKSVSLNVGDKVLVTSTHISWNALIKVRPIGNPEEYWAPYIILTG